MKQGLSTKYTKDTKGMGRFSCLWCVSWTNPATPNFF